MKVITKSTDECLLLAELENAISELVEKYKQDAHALRYWVIWINHVSITALQINWIIY